VYKFPKNLGATSKFWSPAWWNHQVPYCVPRNIRFHWREIPTWCNNLFIII